MECMTKFHTSSQPMQQLDNHKYSQEMYPSSEIVTEKNLELKCSMCSYSPENSFSSEESNDAIRKHTILEHFKAKIPPSLIKGPDITPILKEKNVQTSHSND